MKTTTINDIAKRVKRQEGKVAILIGAGCSISGNIPGCDGMTKDLERDFADLVLDCPTKDYKSYMQELSKQERKDFISAYIERAKLNMAHIFLASLVKNCMVDCIMTTNFDNLMVKGLNFFNIYPAVYDLAASAKYITGSISYPAVVYLHGQHTGWQLNLDGEMEGVSQSVEGAMNEVLKDHTLIVIGYSGNDPVLNILQKHGQFNEKAYWVGYKDHTPSERVKELFFKDSNADTHYLPGEDADSFFFKLHQRLALDAPMLFSNPFDHLREMYSIVSEELKVDDKRHDLVKDALEIIKQAEKNSKEEMVTGSKGKKRVNASLNLAQLRSLAKKSWLSWKRNNPDDLLEAVKQSGDEKAKMYLSDAYIDKGCSYFDLKNYEKAIADYGQALVLKPDYAEAYYNRGICFYNLREYGKSLDAYSQALILKPDYADAYINRGISYDDLKDYNKAIADYGEAIALQPYNAIAYNNRGSSYFSLKNFEKALDDYNKAIDLNSEYGLAYNNRGSIYFSLKDFKKAIIDYNKAIDIEPDDFELYNKRGSSYDNLKDYEKAIADFSEAITLNPENALAYNNRGNSYRQQGNLELALKNANKALELDPIDGTTYSTLAEIYAMQGKHEDFYKNIAQALEKDCPVWEFMNEDEVYKPFLQEKRFQELIAKYKK